MFVALLLAAVLVASVLLGGPQEGQMPSLDPPAQCQVCDEGE